jgi:hypothetical protein
MPIWAAAHPAFFFFLQKKKKKQKEEWQKISITQQIQQEKAAWFGRSQKRPAS